MRIKLKSKVFGAWQGNKGDEVDRPDAEAAKLIAAGFAEPVKVQQPLETAVVHEDLEDRTRD